MTLPLVLLLALLFQADGTRAQGAVDRAAPDPPLDKLTTVVGCLELTTEPGAFVITHARILPDAPRAPGSRDEDEGAGAGAGEDEARGARAETKGARDRERSGRNPDRLAYQVRPMEDLALEAHVGRVVRLRGVFVPEAAHAEVDDPDRPGTTLDVRIQEERQRTVGTVGRRADTYDLAGWFDAYAVTQVEPACQHLR